MYKLGTKEAKTFVKNGDCPADLAAGINANCLYTFAVTNGSHTSQKLAQSPNHGLLNSLLELKGKIGDWVK